MELRIQLHPFTCEYLALQPSNVAQTILSIQKVILGTLAKGQCAQFWLLYSVLLVYISIFRLVSYCFNVNIYVFIHISYLYVKSGSVMFHLCSFSRSLLAILSLLLFNINFRIIFYCCKNYYWDLDGNLNQDLEVLSAVPRVFQHYSHYT